MVYIDFCNIGYGPNVIINQWIVLRNGQFVISVLGNFVLVRSFMH